MSELGEFRPAAEPVAFSEGASEVGDLEPGGGGRRQWSPDFFGWFETVVFRVDEGVFDQVSGRGEGVSPLLEFVRSIKAGEQELRAGGIAGYLIKMGVGDGEVAVDPLAEGVIREVGSFEGDPVKFVYEEGVGKMTTGIPAEVGAVAGAPGAIASEGGVEYPGVGEEGAAGQGAACQLHEVVAREIGLNAQPELAEPRPPQVDVEGVVAAAPDGHMAEVDRAAEDLDPVVGIAEDLHIVDFCTPADAGQRQAVDFIAIADVESISDLNRAVLNIREIAGISYTQTILGMELRL